MLIYPTDINPDERELAEARLRELAEKLTADGIASKSVIGGRVCAASSTGHNMVASSAKRRQVCWLVVALGFVGYLRGRSG